MRKIILFSVIQQLLYHISRVESLIGARIGQNFTRIRSGQFPFIASFQYFPARQNFCGGSLITDKHVITSAYCVKDKSRESFRILFENAHVQEVAMTYTAASWTTYIDWARRQRKQYDRSDTLGMTIVTLTDRVHHINPVPLNGLTKRQLEGKEAKIIGWRDNILMKATVKLLSDEDCERSVRVLYATAAVHDRGLCSAARPFALLGPADIGSPLLHARDNSLLGIAFGRAPGDDYVQGHFSTEFIRQHQTNVHFSVRYYRSFIYSFIPAAPAA